MNNQPASGLGIGTPSLVTLGQHHPKAAETAFIAPGAVLIGHVTISAEASIWYGAVLRADLDSIFVGERSNVQDGCVLHTDAGVPLSLAALHRRGGEQDAQLRGQEPHLNQRPGKDTTR
jgi:hypothetical protein